MTVGALTAGHNVGSSVDREGVVVSGFAVVVLMTVGPSVDTTDVVVSGFVYTVEMAFVCVVTVCCCCKAQCINNWYQKILLYKLTLKLQ